MGKVYLVGAGPGDLKLITLRGFELIQQADTIVYDYLAGKELLDYARKDSELIYVGKRASQHEMAQSEINTLLSDKVQHKKIVVRLKGGDPFIFGRGGEEALFLAEKGIPFEIVPGITSAISVPSYAGIPLTHRDYASSVAFIAGHEDENKAESSIRWDDIAHGVDTLVFLMGIGNIGHIRDRLIAAGKDPQTPACIIQRGTTPEQKIVTAPLADIDTCAAREGIRPPGIIIVGKVALLRNHLAWFEQKPLFGKKIAVTRAPAQSSGIRELLSETGARVISLPTIEITPITPNDPATVAIDNIRAYQYVIFTSTNGASLFFDLMSGRGVDARMFHGAKIISIGETTALYLRSRGIISDYIPTRFTSEGIIDILKTIPVKDNRFLLPRAEEARNIIPEFIGSNGGICDTIPVYRTDLPANPVPMEEKPDIITFTSSSTANNFIRIYGKTPLQECTIASIGPITSDTLKKNGIHVHIEAKKYDIRGLIDAIIEYFTNER